MRDLLKWGLIGGGAFFLFRDQIMSAIGGEQPSAAPSTVPPATTAPPAALPPAVVPPPVYVPPVYAPPPAAQPTTRAQ